MAGLKDNLTRVPDAMPSMTRKTIGFGLKAARKRAGYKTATAFAATVGCTPQQWAKIESGQQNYASLPEAVRREAESILDDAGGHLVLRHAMEGQTGVQVTHVERDALEKELAEKYGSQLHPVRMTLAQARKRLYRIAAMKGTKKDAPQGAPSAKIECK